MILYIWITTQHCETISKNLISLYREGSIHRQLTSLFFRTIHMMSGGPFPPCHLGNRCIMFYSVTWLINAYFFILLWGKKKAYSRNSEKFFLVTLPRSLLRVYFSGRKLSRTDYLCTSNAALHSCRKRLHDDDGTPACANSQHLLAKKKKGCRFRSVSFLFLSKSSQALEQVANNKLLKIRSNFRRYIEQITST